jgi:ABC-2 type transport system permease protein
MSLLPENDPVAAFAVLGWRVAGAERLAMAARCLLYALLLAIFAGFWRATPLAALGRNEFTPERLIWYLTITEWIVFAGGMPYREIEADVRSGAIAVGLGRPVPYSLACLAAWCGALFYRLVVFGLAGGVAAIMLTGTMPLTAGAIASLAVSGVLATLSIQLWQLIIGLCSVWTGTAAPFYWIWMKALFVAGGLIVPLDLYPQVVRAGIETSPFAAMIWAPASLALDPSPGRAAWVLALQLFWLAVLGPLVWLIDRAATGRLLEQGA